MLDTLRKVTAENILSHESISFVPLMGGKNSKDMLYKQWRLWPEILTTKRTDQ
jgi:hypothetical protein